MKIKYIHWAGSFGTIFAGIRSVFADLFLFIYLFINLFFSFLFIYLFLEGDFFPIPEIFRKKTNSLYEIVVERDKLMDFSSSFRLPEIKDSIIIFRKNLFKKIKEHRKRGFFCDDS